MKPHVVQITIRHIISLDEIPNILVWPFKYGRNNHFVFSIYAIDFRFGICFKKLFAALDCMQLSIMYFITDTLPQYFYIVPLCPSAWFGFAYAQASTRTPPPLVLLGTHNKTLLVVSATFSSSKLVGAYSVWASSNGLADNWCAQTSLGLENQRLWLAFLHDV